MEYIIKVPLDFKWTDQHLCVNSYAPDSIEIHSKTQNLLAFAETKIKQKLHVHFNYCWSYIVHQKWNVECSLLNSIIF